MKLYHFTTKFKYNRDLLHTEFYTFSSSIKKAKEKAWDNFRKKFSERYVGLSYKKFIINTRIRNHKELVEIIKVLVSRLFKRFK